MALPSGYKQLGYIESTGTQYINTGFAPNSNTRVVADFQKVVSENTWVFGSRVAFNSGQFDIFTETNDGSFWRIDIGSAQNKLTGVAFTDRVVADVSMDLVQIGSASMTPTVSEFTSTVPIYIFALNNNGSAYKLSATRLYSCKIYDNGTLVRDFIPCTNASGTVGLWDDVNSVFYCNVGTGTFIVGELSKAHKTRINGTVYEITGGKVLVNGTGYEIKKGRTLVGGTGYDIKFDGDIRTITITGINYADRLWVQINGVKYGTVSGTLERIDDITIEVEVGTEIECGMYYKDTSGSTTHAYIELNDTTVASGTMHSGVYYTHTITTNTNIQLLEPDSKIIITEE